MWSTLYIAFDYPFIEVQGKMEAQSDEKLSNRECYWSQRFNKSC